MSLPPLLTTLDTYTQSAVDHMIRTSQGSPPRDGFDANKQSSVSQHPAVASAPSAIRASKPKDSMDKPGQSPRPLKGNKQGRIVKPASASSGRGEASVPQLGSSLDSNSVDDTEPATTAPINSNHTSNNNNNNSNINHHQPPHVNNNISNNHRASQLRKRSVRPGAKAPPEKMMGQPLNPSFARAIEALASIRLHAFSMKRKDLINQKMELLNEIKAYQQENFQESVDSIQEQFKFILAAWKLRYFAELWRFKHLKGRFLMDKKASLEREERLKASLDSQRSQSREKESEIHALRLLMEEKRGVLDELRQNSASLAERERQKSVEAISWKEKFGISDAQVTKLSAEIEVLKKKLADETDKCKLIANELELTKVTCQEVMVRNADLEKIQANHDALIADLHSNFERTKEALGQVHHQSESTFQQILAKRDEEDERKDSLHQSQMSILAQETAFLNDVVESKNKIIEELNARVSLLEDQKRESLNAIETQTISNVDITSELSRAKEEKASLQVVITDLAIKMQKAEQENVEKDAAIEKLQTKYNSQKFSKASLKIVVQIMESEISTLKERLQQEEEERIEQLRLNEMARMKVEDLEVGWSGTLTSLVKTAGYCRFLEDQLFSMRRMRGQTPTTPGGVLTAAQWDNQFFNSWSDSTYGKNGGSNLDGSKKNRSLSSGDGNRSKRDRTPDKKVAFNLDPNELSPVANNSVSGEGSAESAGLMKMTAIVQNLEQKLKEANEITSDARRMMGGASLEFDSPTKKSASQVVSYTVQKEQLLRIYGNLERKLAKSKDDTNDDFNNVQRSFGVIQSLLDKKKSLLLSVAAWWDKYVAANLRVPSEEEFTWHIPVISESMEACDLNLHHNLTVLLQTVSQLKGRIQDTDDMDQLFKRTKTALSGLHKHIDNSEIMSIIQEFERLEIDSSSTKPVANFIGNLSSSQLADNINAHLVDLNLHPMTINWNISIPHYECYVSNVFPQVYLDAINELTLPAVNEADIEAKRLAEAEAKLTPEELAIRKTKETYAANVSKLKETEDSLQQRLHAFDANKREISILLPQLLKEEEKMVDWVAQFSKICKRNATTQDKLNSNLFLALWKKYESIRDKILHITDGNEIIRGDLSRMVDVHVSLVEFLKSNCKSCFVESDINREIVPRVERAIQAPVDAIKFQTIETIATVTESPTSSPKANKRVIASREGSSRPAEVKVTDDVVNPLFSKIEFSQVDLLKDSFLSKLRSENIQLRQQLKEARMSSRIYQKRLNEASRLVNIWLNSYQSTHRGETPSKETMQSLAKDIYDGVNEANEKVLNNQKEIEALLSALKERKEILNQILLARKDLAHESWFDEPDESASNSIATGIEPDGSRYQETQELALRGDELLSTSLATESLQTASLISEFSFAIDKGASVKDLGSNVSTKKSQGPSGKTTVVDTDPLPENLEDLKKEIDIVKIQVKSLKDEYETIKTKYKAIDAERIATRNALNEWATTFRNANGRDATQSEKSAQCQALMVQQASCQDRLVDAFSSMTDLKAKFDRGQSRLARLKEKKGAMELGYESAESL